MTTFQKSGMPNIPEAFPAGYPDHYKLRPQTFALTREELRETLEDGTPKLLAMDINISEDGYIQAVNTGNSKTLNKRAEKFYDCDIGCEHCFDCKTKTNNPLMQTEEVFAMLLEAKKCGLKMVKFLGPGELLHNPRLFEILDFLRNNDIRIGIFTKGLILGKDSYAIEKFGIDSKSFCQKLYSYDNVSLLYSITSSDSATETKRINSQKNPDLFTIRNRGFENAFQAGFMGDLKDQRLTIICTPVLEDNIDEVTEIYAWAMKRNIPMIIAPTMISGKGLDQKEVKDETFKTEKLIDVYANIYVLQIQNGLTTFDQIKQDGVSPYAGIPCNWFRAGFMQRKDGKLQGCPGNESAPYVYTKDLRTAGPLIDQRKASLNCALRKEALAKGDDMPLTNPCYAKEELLTFPDGRVRVQKGCGSIPDGFADRVLEKITQRLLDHVK